MQRVNPQSQVILEVLTAGLTAPDKCDAPGTTSSRKLDAGGPGIMAVCVERIARSAYSVAHYFTQNGDLMADPEMIFVRTSDGAFWPVYFKQDSLGLEQESADWREEEDGVRFQHVRAALQADHALFADDWLLNILRQQGFPLPATSAA